jgi:hypothetical protein
MREIDGFVHFQDRVVRVGLEDFTHFDVARHIVLCNVGPVSLDLSVESVDPGIDRPTVMFVFHISRNWLRLSGRRRPGCRSRVLTDRG